MTAAARLDLIFRLSAEPRIPERHRRHDAVQLTTSNSQRAPADPGRHIRHRDGYGPNKGPVRFSFESPLEQAIRPEPGGYDGQAVLTSPERHDRGPPTVSPTSDAWSDIARQEEHHDDAEDYQNHEVANELPLRLCRCPISLLRRRSTAIGATGQRFIEGVSAVITFGFGKGAPCQAVGAGQAPLTPKAYRASRR